MLKYTVVADPTSQNSARVCSTELQDTPVQTLQEEHDTMLQLFTALQLIDTHTSCRIVKTLQRQKVSLAQPYKSLYVLLELLLVETETDHNTAPLTQLKAFTS